MQTSPAIHPLWPVDREVSIEALNLVVLYDAVSSCKRSISVLAGMARMEDGGPLEINPLPWKFDFLNDPAAFREAMRDAAIADMIVVCTEETSLPAVVKTWLQFALEQRRESNLAMVAFLGGTKKAIEADSRDFDLMREMAFNTEVCFFAPDFGCHYSAGAVAANKRFSSSLSRSKLQSRRSIS